MYSLIPRVCSKRSRARQGMAHMEEKLTTLGQKENNSYIFLLVFSSGCFVLSKFMPTFEKLLELIHWALSCWNIYSTLWLGILTKTSIQDYHLRQRSLILLPLRFNPCCLLSKPSPPVHRGFTTDTNTSSSAKKLEIATPKKQPKSSQRFSMTHREKTFGGESAFWPLLATEDGGVQASRLLSSLTKYLFNRE